MYCCRWLALILDFCEYCLWLNGFIDTNFTKKNDDVEECCWDNNVIPVRPSIQPVRLLVP